MTPIERAKEWLGRDELGLSCLVEDTVIITDLIAEVERLEKEEAAWREINKAAARTVDLLEKKCGDDLVDYAYESANFCNKIAELQSQLSRYQERFGDIDEC